MKNKALLYLFISLIVCLTLLIETPRISGEEYVPNTYPAHINQPEHFITLPLQLYGALDLRTGNPSSAASKPTGIDLDVTYISRLPSHNRYKVWYTDEGNPYLSPGTENDQRWPELGDVVTFQAHIINKGTLTSGVFDIQWYIDGVKVHFATHPGLEPGEETIENYQWNWAHSLAGENLLGEHTIKFAIDQSNDIAETYETNNILEERTDALGIQLALTPELYEALETPVDPKWSYSAEDWLQKQIHAMNDAFAHSIYSSAPDGVRERVRLDRIIISTVAPSTDWSVDGGFFMSADDRFGNPYYDPESDVSGSLLHELTHQLGIIDMYNLDVPLETTQVLDRHNRPIQIGFSTSSSFPGLMNQPGIVPPQYDEHTTLALNANKGFRRGYYGEYLFDVSDTTSLRIYNNEGLPATAVEVRLYQRTSDQGLLGGRFGIIDNTPEFIGFTDSNGIVMLNNRSVGIPVETNTGHTLHDNPFGNIDVVGRNNEFLLSLTFGSHQEFQWLDITDFNITYWRGQDLIDLKSHIPPQNLSSNSINLTGTLGFGSVDLSWSDYSPDHTIGYNVYRAGYPEFEFQKVLTETTVLSLNEPYDYSSPAAIYAVTAVKGQGQESGFSNLFYALRVMNPTAVLIDGIDKRIILDPQNGYALLYQQQDGTIFDTISSFDYHLEYSEYMTRDWLGQLIVSHPGDYYSNRHSIRIFDSNFNLISEFGESGTGLGQLHNPAGVAVWGQGCGDNTCRYLVVDSGNNRIQILDEEGNFINAYGSTGDGNGQFKNPQGITVDFDGDIIVTDSDNDRLQILDFDGTALTYQKSIYSDLNKPTGLAVYGRSSLVVADTGNNKIKILDKEGGFITEFDRPNDGSPGGFNEPRGVAADVMGNIVVADTGNGRVVTLLNVLPSWAAYVPIVSSLP